MKRKTNQSGFTLVELSIVLVIIGLLVGGILVSQSLIDSVKVKRFISGVVQIDILYNEFVRKYKQYPGDSNAFSNPGNNNKNYDFVLWCEECLNFYVHLSEGVGLKSEEGADYVTMSGADNIKSECPQLSLESFTDDPSNACLSVGLGLNFHTGSYAGVIKTTPPNVAYYYNSRSTGGLSSVIAYEVDKKIDDGLPRSGFVSNQTNTGYSAGCDDTGNLNYELENPNFSCGLGISFGKVLENY